MTQPTTAARPWLLPLIAYSAPLACLLWAFWTTLGEAAQRWAVDPSYSHGYLVPLFAVLLLALRRNRMSANLLRPDWFWGTLLLTAGVLLRLVATYYHFVSLDPLSLLPCVAGIVLLIGGWPTLRWAWASVLFLGFMIPLPYRVAGAMAEPLQRFATIVSTFLLQSFGLPALAEGNVILLSEVEMGIVEACSGLRMLFVFFALSTAFALVVRRYWVEKLLIVLSAVPIALACNVIRITATGMLHEAVSTGGILNGVLSREVPNAIFHDLAGWLMMPLGLLMLWGELKLLGLMWTEPGATADVVQYARVPAPRTVVAAVPTPPPAPASVPAAPIAVTPPAPRARRPWQPAKSSRAARPAGSA